jgi:hypothetical protein
MAFDAAKKGMSEAEVRAIFGPPDFVVVSVEELNPNEQIWYSMAGKGGAYYYKIGRFADIVATSSTPPLFPEAGITQRSLLDSVRSGGEG